MTKEEKLLIIKQAANEYLETPEYENATIYLDRKYQIYKQFCQHEEESSLKKSSKIGEGCDANTEVSSEIAKGSETLQSVVGE